jgi:hypothetical protein
MLTFLTRVERVVRLVGLRRGDDDGDMHQHQRRHDATPPGQIEEAGKQKQTLDRRLLVSAMVPLRPYGAGCLTVF